MVLPVLEVNSEESFWVPVITLICFEMALLFTPISESVPASVTLVFVTFSFGYSSPITSLVC